MREPLAIVGMGCRFPGGASTPERFWNLLRDGHDAIIDVPEQRWSLDRFYDPDPARLGKMFVRQGGFLREPVDEFDAQFFRLSPREAATLDPQQRLLLEVSYEALEDAGLPLDEAARRRTGVFVGGFALDNKIMQLGVANRERSAIYTATSSSMALLANRISYAFDLKGPSVAMDTACSSSLVALHFACNSLLAGESDVALVGGVNVMLSPDTIVAWCKGGFLSPDGRSKAFDSRADGYGRGEGAAIIVLETLSAAVANGDRIYSLIRATGVNQDGRTNGLTVPSGEAQRDLIETVLARAEVSPDTIQYVEAHGTGTAIGDPIEARAIGEALGKPRRNGQLLVVGSVKTNIGHLEAAAGVAALIKTSLALTHGLIPPSLHIERLNPNIPFDELNLRVPLAAEPWPREATPRRAAINSFGYGGTNAHVILEEYEPPIAAPRSAPAGATGSDAPFPLYFPLSARDARALREYAERYAAALSPDGSLADVSLDDVCYTAIERRSRHELRVALVANSRHELIERLRAVARGEGKIETADEQHRSRLCFVYTGMGPQWWAMGRGMLRDEPVFRDEVHRIDGIFRRIAEWSILEELTRPESESKMARTAIAQPANFALQVALTAVWRSWGIEPAAAVGHSVGEVSAAYASGALDLEDALRVSYHRARLQQTTAGHGGMLAVSLPEAVATSLLRGLEDQVGIASINSPTSVTLAGDVGALAELKKLLDEERVFCRMLRVEVPYHSFKMDPLRDEVLSSLRDVRPAAPRFPLYSTVTGGAVQHAVHDNEYWWQNVRQPVRFHRAIGAMLDKGFRHFVEIGPHPVLANSIGETAAERQIRVVTVHSLKREEPERRTMLEALGRLFERGHTVNGRALFPSGRFVSLPRYPWQRQRHWDESVAMREHRLGTTGHPLLGLSQHTPVPSWEVELNRQYFPYLRDHVVGGNPIFPGAGYAEIGLALTGGAAHEPRSVEKLEFHMPLDLSDADAPFMRVTHDPERGELSIHWRRHSDVDNWMLCASGVVARVPAGLSGGSPSLTELRQRCPETRGADVVYEKLQRFGLEYGPEFRRIEQLHVGRGEALARVGAPPQGGSNDAYQLHPVVFDAALQAFVALVDDRPGTALMPSAIARVTSYRGVDGPTWAHVRVVTETATLIVGDVDLFNEAEEVVASARGVALRAMGTADAGPRPGQGWFYGLRWRPRDEPVLANPSRRRWLILAHEPGLPNTLSTALAPGSRVMPLNGESLPAGVLSDFDGVVYMAPTRLDTAATADPARRAIELSEAFLLVLQSLVAQSSAAHLVVVTRNAARVTAEDTADGFWQWAAIGLGRVCRTEAPHLRVRTVDIDAAVDVDALCATIDNVDDPEVDVALRGRRRWSQRVVRAPKARSDAPWPPLNREDHAAYCAVLDQAGAGAQFRFERCARVTPAAGEVEIEVHATALNYKDVMKARGMLSTTVLADTYYGTAIGMECSGRVVRVGDGVRGLAVGDEIVSIARGALCSHVNVKADFTCKRPANMTLTEAAAPLVALLSAWYALRDVARLQSGERILIHTATGGVGLYAIQIAQLIGAEVFATAGNPAKRALLRKLGVQHVSDSRSLTFADDVRRWTDGQGVDVVLNTLAHDAIRRGLDLLRPCGRFIELGKRDIDEDNALRLGTFNGNRAFISVDFDRIAAERPDIVQRVMAEAWRALNDGVLAPIPVQVYDADAIGEAFDLMGRGEHVGKVVVSFEHPPSVIDPPPRAEPEIHANATYLVTGGLAGFGAEVARWLVARGARHLVLVSRRGADTPEASDTLRDLRASGADVWAERCDVTRPDDVAAVLQMARAELPPLRGVFHCAMVLDDATISTTTTDQVRRVMAPKVFGAWHLHDQTRGDNLDHFVLFSSISSLIGNAGQSSYVAANAFLDGLAAHRRASALPALAINWGVFGDTGVAARAIDTRAHLGRLGIEPFTNAQALEAMSIALAGDPVETAIVDIDWAKWGRATTHVAQTATFEDVSQLGNLTGESMDITTRLLSLSPEQRVELMTQRLMELFAEIVRLPVAKLSPNESLRNLGIDSLISVELSNALQRELGVTLPLVDFLGGRTSAGLAVRLLHAMRLSDSLPPVTATYSLAELYTPAPSLSATGGD